MFRPSRLATAMKMDALMIHRPAAIMDLALLTQLLLAVVEVVERV